MQEDVFDHIEPLLLFLLLFDYLPITNIRVLTDVFTLLFLAGFDFRVLSKFVLLIGFLLKIAATKKLNMGICLICCYGFWCSTLGDSASSSFVGWRQSITVYLIFMINMLQVHFCVVMLELIWLLNQVDCCACKDIHISRKFTLCL